MTHILAATLLNRSTSEVASGLNDGRVESHDVEILIGRGGFGVEQSIG